MYNMNVEKTYKLEIQGRFFTFTEEQAKELFAALKNAFKEVDTISLQPSQSSEAGLSSEDS